jgi:hypothetical protein
MKTPGKPTILDDGDDQQQQQHQRSLWPPRQQAILLVALLLFDAVAGMALYRFYKLMAAPQLRICELGPLVFNRLNSTMGVLKLNIALCWR